MRNTILSVILLSVFIFGVNDGFGQKINLEGALKVQLRNSGEIIQDNQIKGYYFFYMVDRVNMKNSEYLLKILDANLNEVASKTIIDSKYSHLTEGIFNGQTLMLEFYNVRKKEFTLRMFDVESNIIGEHIVGDLSIYMNPVPVNDEIRGNYLFGVPGKGFVFYKITKNKKIGFELNFFSNEGEEGWDYKSHLKSDQIQTATFLAADEDVVASIVLKRPKTYSMANTTSHLLVLDSKTGEKRFEHILTAKRYDLEVLNGFFNTLTGHITVMGLAYQKGEGIKSKSKGMFAMQIDRDGDVVSNSMISWTEDVANYFPVNEKGKFEDIGYLYFHTMLQDNQGRFYAVAEQYRRAVSAGGIAITALAAATGSYSSGVGVTKIVTEDIMIFEFSPEFELEGVEVFDKSKNDVHLPSIDFLSIQMIGRLMKIYDTFDYSFSQTTKDKSVFSATYIDYEKIKGEKNKFVFGAISHTSSGYNVDKIDLVSDATFLRVYPAKPGYVMIAEYDKKMKRIYIHLEQINY